MTQDIGSGAHREPSSASIDIARLKERHNALKDDVSDMRSVVMDIKGLLLSHITSAGERHAQLLATFNQHNLEDTVVHQRVIVLAETVKEMGADSKRDPVSFWTSMGAALTTVGGIIYMIMHGGQPPAGHQ